MSMYKNIQDIFKVLRNDEQLLRLLHNEPKNISKKIPDPLDSSLPNILDKPPLELTQLKNKLIMSVPKDDDLIKDRKCVIFAYLGDRYSDRRNYVMANQYIMFDVFCHVDFENGDFRSSRIGDRLNHLFALEHVTGFGKVDFERVRIINRVPSQFVGYQYVYEIGATKK